ncbi:MAG: RES family NAD+ phosphorylase [Verrucomicrobiales bacterium]|nr:RES family NAD+ phosphorylase [Verrucomicrobiales bacterium]
MKDNPQVIEQRWICPNCVTEKFIDELLARVPNLCSYCGKKDDAAISIESLAERTETVINKYFLYSEFEPHSTNIKGKTLGDLIACNTGAKQEAIVDICSVLKQRGKIDSADQSAFYYNLGINEVGEWDKLWNQFTEEIYTKGRFFSKLARDTLDQIFEGVFDFETDGESIIVKAGPNEELNELHRARNFFDDYKMFQSALCEPWKQIGPPPPENARPGRMNPQGISVFYGALKPDVALAEVRPPVGSRVIVARFKIQRELRLLNVPALESIPVFGSLFNESDIQRVQRANFLRNLNNSISRPVMPGKEATDYLPTQAVAEYLASVAGLDGMIYSTPQYNHESTNVVLFQHASRIEMESLPENCKPFVNETHVELDPNRIQIDIVVKSLPVGKSGSLNEIEVAATESTMATVPVSLKLDLCSIRTYYVKKADLTTESHCVSWQESEQKNVGSFPTF